MAWNNSSKKKNISKELLIELYIENQLRKEEIAEKLEVSRQTIERRLREYEIPIRHEKYTYKTREEILSKEDFKKEYIDNNLSMKEMMTKYGMTKKQLVRLINLYDMHKSKELEIQSRQKLNMERYGVKEVLSSREVREKIKQTNIEKYGVENVFAAKEIKEKVKQTNLEKYGAENVWSKGSSVLEKVKQTNLEKYGADNPWSSDVVKDKIKNTNLNRYGTEYPLQSEDVKQTMFSNNIKKYGVKHVQQVESIKEKTRKTNIERYGCEYGLSNEEIKNKIRQTNLEKYGYENAAKSDIVKEKTKLTNLERYGVRYTLQDSDIKNKIRQTNLEKYGVEYYCMTEDCINKNKVYRVSKINKEFYNKLIDNNINCELEYYIGTKGFDIKVNNILIEINPSYTHNSTFEAKFKSCSIPPKEHDYHLNKSKLAEEHGFQCIHIFDWDDEDKIINLLLPKTTLYARNCEIKEISIKEANDFLNLYHLQGSLTKQTVCLGLFYNNELIELMTFGKPRYNKNYQYELLRLCTHKDYKVTGGTQKLFKYFIDNFKPESIISYCDISKFTGEVYNKLGFTLKSSSNPARHWYNIKTKQHITDNLLRQRGFDQLFGTSYGKGTSNDLLMLEHNFVEVYDCGQSTYTWSKKDFK